jgi:hypothetical protein
VDYIIIFGGAPPPSYGGGGYPLPPFPAEGGDGDLPPSKMGGKAAPPIFDGGRGEEKIGNWRSPPFLLWRMAERSSALLRMGGGRGGERGGKSNFIFKKEGERFMNIHMSKPSFSKIKEK